LALAARLIGHGGVWALLPLAVVAGVGSGGGIGLLARWSLGRLR